MDAAGYIYIYKTAIIFAGLVCVVLLFALINQYRCNKSVNRITLVLTVVVNTLFIAVFWEPVVTALVVIPSMCNELGGLHIHKKVQANGFFANVFYKRYLTDYGYSFIEYVDYTHYSKKRYVTKRIGKNGDIEIDDLWEGKEPQSRYHYVTHQHFEIEKTGILKYLNVRGESDYVLDTHENKVIGEIKRYRYAGSEFRYAMYRMLTDKKETCCSPEHDPKDIPLPLHVLLPSR